MTVTPDQVKARARELDFIACGITDPSPTAHGAELDRWLARGYAGTMRYLHRQARRRKDPRAIVAEARAVVVVLDNYYEEKGERDGQGVEGGRAQSGPKVAKYAQGDDYHAVTQGRLEKLAEFLRHNGATVARTYADAGPVPERELAQRAGLGWIGKNTMLVRPGVGSWFFIGSIFTDLALALDSPFESDRCGSCTRCLDACPTGAFVEPRVLDATRCISYLTIEQKGPIAGELAGRMDGWVFGCDACNDVCPWNQRFAAPTAVEAFRPRGHLDGADPDFFERMDDAEFERRFGRTPLARPGLAGMRRNFRAAFSRRTDG